MENDNSHPQLFQVENAQLLLNGTVSQRSNISEVLLAAAWICGEYSELVYHLIYLFELL